MTWVAAAIIGGAVVGAGASALSASSQSGAIRDTSAASIAEQRRQFDIAQELTQPRREAENAALQQLQNILGIGTEQVDLSGLQIPGQQFAIDEASQAIERSAAARGGLVGGGTLAELQSRALGITNQNFLSNFLNPLQNLALGGQGQQSAQGALNLGVNVGNTLSQAGVNRANILGQGIQGVGNALQGGISNFLLQQQLSNPAIIQPQFGGTGGTV